VSTLLAIMFLGGCGSRAVAVEGPEDPDPHATPDPMEPEMTPKWTTHPLPEVDLTLDIFDDRSGLTVRTDGEVHALVQETGAIRLGIWAGPGQDLDRWRERLALRQVSFGPVDDVEVCSATGRLQTAEVAAAAGAIGGWPQGDGTIEHRAAEFGAEHQAAMHFVHGGRSVLVTWAVPLGQREAWAAAEAHFFGGVRCG